MQNNIYKKGDTFGRLTLTGESYIRKYEDGSTRRMYEAKCECGIIKGYAGRKLKSGETKSCGCLQREVVGKIASTHRLSGHPLYEVYEGMKKRCYNTRSDRYKDYGGRGIFISPLWDNFIDFYNWAIANGWERGLSIHRVNNDDIYKPDNCIFTTVAIQNRASRQNRFITAWNETKCLFDWGRDYRCIITPRALKARLDTGKWTNMEDMISRPHLDRKVVMRKAVHVRYLTAFNEKKGIKEWVEDSRCNVCEQNIRIRLKKGWDVEKALTFPAAKNGSNKNIKTVIEAARE